MIQKIQKTSKLKKLLKQQRNTRENMQFLFVSPWNPICEDLLTAIEESESFSQDLNIVDIFDIPHATSIFLISRLPALVRLSSKGTMVEDYTSMIYATLDL